MTKRKRVEYEPSGWQLDPESLDPSLTTVQFWTGGIMATAQFRLTDAKKSVRDGEAFVISSQAVGSMDKGVSTA